MVKLICTTFKIQDRSISHQSVRWRALQERQIYVKQNLSSVKIDITDIQEMIANRDNNLEARIMRYGEGLHGTRQIWIAQRSNKLKDMIKQIGHQDLIYFFF